MQNMHMRFCLAIIFFCRASHSEGWIGKVLNCIKVKRTEWALWRWHRSRGESAINVNAFSVSSTSFLRPHLLLPKKVLIDSCGTSSPEHICCLYTKRIFLSMRCELECRSSWSQSVSAHFYSPFYSLDLVQINRSVGLYMRCTGIFLMANSSWTFLCVEGREKKCSLELFSFIPVIHIHPEQAHRAHLQYILSEQKCCSCWVSYCSFSHYFCWPD